jgi:hypothetical protein
MGAGDTNRLLPGDGDTSLVSRRGLVGLDVLLLFLAWLEGYLLEAESTPLPCG